MIDMWLERWPDDDVVVIIMLTIHALYYRKSLEEDETLTWIAVSIWGFEDSPVSWKNNEHGWYNSGDNHYNIIVFKTGEFWLIKTLSTYDVTS